MSANSSQAWMGFLHDKTTTSNRLLQSEPQNNHAGWGQLTQFAARHPFYIRDIEGGEGVRDNALNPKLLGQVCFDILE